MTRLFSKSWIYIAALLFVAVNLFLIFQYEFYWLLFLPVAIIVVYWAFFSLDTLLGFIVICTPISFSLEHGIGGIGMYLPTDPLMFGVLLVFLLKLIYEQHFDKKILLHPITIVILIQLSWMLITSFTSSMSIVSFKSLTARLWYVVSFFFLGTQLFKNRKNLVRFQWWYLVPLVAVIIYTLVRESHFNFNEQQAHWVMEPFFKDHTIYGAALAIFVPPAIYLLQRKQQPILRIISFFILVILLVGVAFSYTRAAWLGLAGALVLYFIYKIKIKFRTLLVAIVGLAALVFVSWNVIFWNISSNTQTAKSSNFEKHIQSMTNITTDNSNMERINRWVAAWEMFQAKPVFGFGPGTFAAQYAPFQLPQYKTYISTNAGNRGNAHSEYIGPLAEEGVVGFLIVVLLVIVIFYRGSNLYHRLPRGDLKDFTLAILLGLATYFIHGLVNDFLSSDKLSVPVWAFAAMLVAIEVYHEKEPKKSILNRNHYD